MSPGFSVDNIMFLAAHLIIQGTNDLLLILFLPKKLLLLAPPKKHNFLSAILCFSVKVGGKLDKLQSC